MDELSHNVWYHMDASNFVCRRHVVNASGENWHLGLLDFTGCEMVLVLKLIAFAVSRQDHWQAKKKAKARISR